MKKINNKVLIIVLSVVVGVLALGGIVTAFILNYNVFSPEKVEIIDDGSSVYLTTTANDNYKSYRFKFVDEENNEIIIDSESNILTLPELQNNGIEIGKTYKISTCYISDNDGNNSQFSQEISWKVYTYLSAPVVTYNTEYNHLSWEEIVNADYYKVFYNSGSDYVYYQTTETSVDLQLISGGNREFYVVAYSNNDSYRQSSKSNVLEMEVVHNYKDFLKVTIDKETKTLKIYGEELLQKIAVYIEGVSYEVIDFKFEYDEQLNQYIYYVDISLIYSDTENIGASPMTIDKYNVFAGNVTYLTDEAETSKN